MNHGRPRITRRGIQVTLGLLWILDGFLQFQPAMLTSKFATQIIAPAGQGQPAFVSWPVHEAARIILVQPAVTDLAFGLIQLALGVGILHRRTVRWALPASVVWALLSGTWARASVIFSGVAPACSPGHREPPWCTRSSRWPW